MGGFLFTDEGPKYLFQLPNLIGSQESQVPPASQVKQSAKCKVDQAAD